jgi:hypothetical protein
MNTAGFPCRVYFEERYSLMSKFRLAHLGLALAALGFTAAAPVVGLAPAYAAEPCALKSANRCSKPSSK